MHATISDTLNIIIAHVYMSYLSAQETVHGTQLQHHGHGDNCQTHNEALVDFPAGQILGYIPGFVGTALKPPPAYQDPVVTVHSP
jgi:hypothetical protein